MIRPPRRSVTRFFIPMIDVLTLLFCMFLLMPIIKENAALTQEESSGGPTADLKREIEARQKELRELYKEQLKAREGLAELEKKKRRLRSLARLLSRSRKGRSALKMEVPLTLVLKMARMERRRNR